MAKATISMDLTSNNNRGGAKHAKGAVTEKADRSSGHDEKLMPAPKPTSKPTSMGCFGSNEHDHRDDRPCINSDKECRLHCDKEEIKYIIRPQKIKIAEVNGTQYGWIKTGFRFIFVASLLVVLLGSPRIFDWSEITYHIIQTSETTATYSVNSDCFGDVCPARDNSSYVVTNAVYSACMKDDPTFGLGYALEGQDYAHCDTSEYGTEKVADKRSNNRCRIVCRKELSESEKGRCESNLFARDSRYHAAGMVSFRSLNLTVKWTDRDMPEYFYSHPTETGIDSSATGSLKGVLMPGPYRGNMLFMLWKDTGIQWWSLEIGYWNQGEANMLDYTELECEAYRNSRVDGMFSVLAICFAVGFLWAIWRIVMRIRRNFEKEANEKKVREDFKKKDDEANLARSGNEQRTHVVFKYIFDSKMDYLRSHSSAVFMITTCFVWSTAFYYYVNIFEAKTFFYVVRAATMWGLACFALRVPNHPDLKEKWTWINWLSMICSLGCFSLSIYVWAKFAKDLWENPLYLANVAFDEDNNLQWHGWLQLSKYGAGAMFGLMVFTRPWLILDDDSQNPDYMQNRVWVVARTSYWNDAMRTFVLVGASAMMSEFAVKDNPWWSFLYWFQSSDLCSQSVQACLIWLFGVSLACFYYPYRNATKPVSQDDIAYSSFSSQNSSKLLEVSSNPEHDMLLHKDPLNQKYRSSFALSPTNEASFVSQVQQKVTVLAKFNKRYGTVSVDVTGIEPEWIQNNSSNPCMQKYTILAVSQTSSDAHAVSDALPMQPVITYVVPNSKLLHGPFYRFKVTFFFDNGTAVESKLSEAPGVVVPEMMQFSASEARELARLSELVYNDDMLTEQEKEEIAYEDQEQKRRASEGSTRSRTGDMPKSQRFKEIKNDEDQERNIYIVKTVFEPRDATTKVNRSPHTSLYNVFCDHGTYPEGYEEMSTDSHAAIFVRKRGPRMFHEVLQTMQQPVTNPKRQLLLQLWACPLDSSVLDLVSPLKFSTITELGVAVLTLVNPGLIPENHKHEHHEFAHKTPEEMAECVKNRASEFQKLCKQKSPGGELWHILTAAMETVHPARIVKVIVAFRGTASARNAVTDVDSAQIPYPGNDREPSPRQKQWMETHGRIYVHQGFSKALVSIFDPAKAGCQVPAGGTLLEQVKDLISEQMRTWGNPPQLAVCGHSLGGALATLFSVEVALDPEMHHVPLKCITFGQPRVMNVSGALFINELLPHYYRIVNEGDPVPTVPKSFAARAEGSCVIPHIYLFGRRFKHCGQEVQMKESGMMVLPMSPLEADAFMNPLAHMMSQYERSLELYLLFRRRWLWKKVVCVLKSVVSIRCRARHTTQDIPELASQHNQTIKDETHMDGLPPNDKCRKCVAEKKSSCACVVDRCTEECVRWKVDGHCLSFAKRGKCCFIHRKRDGNPTRDHTALMGMDTQTLNKDLFSGQMNEFSNPLSTSPKGAKSEGVKFGAKDANTKPSRSFKGKTSGTKGEGDDEECPTSPTINM